MYELTVDTTFSAAHRLRDHPGKCRNLHGHNYRVTVALAGRELNEQDMLVDFGDVKPMVEDAVGRLDHAYMNDLAPFDECNPTSENIARHIGETMSERLPAGLRLSWVRVWESDRCAVTFTPDQATRPG